MLTVGKVPWRVPFDEEGITLVGCKASFTPMMCNTKIELVDDRLKYEYKGHSYALRVSGGSVTRVDGTYIIEAHNGDTVKLIPTKI